MFKRVLICGSRDFTDREFFSLAMEAWVAKHGFPHFIIEGCARGADYLAGHWWTPEIANTSKRFLGEIGVEHFPADWDRHGRAAGPIRNQQMLDEGGPHAVIAFTRDLSTSRGTADMVRRSRAAGLPVWLPVAGSVGCLRACQEGRLEAMARNADFRAGYREGIAHRSISGPLGPNDADPQYDDEPPAREHHTKPR